MSHWMAYLALASFPIAWILALNPVRFSWGLHHGFDPMSLDVRERAERVDVYCYFFMYALTAGFVASLMSHYGVRPSQVGLRLEQWRGNAVIGFAAGALLVLIQAWIAKFIPEGAPLPTTDRFQRKSVGLWLKVLLAGAPVEELWIAFCLVSMRLTGYSAIASVTATVVVFGVVHIGYGFYGASSVSAKSVPSAVLFLWRGSLIPMFLYHFIGNLGILYRLRRTAHMR